MKIEPSRRQWLTGMPSVVAATAAGLSLAPDAAGESGRSDAFAYCLNTSTLQGHKLDLVELVEITAKAGYQAIEPWLAEVDRYTKSGGSVADLGHRIRDHGLKVAGVIAFFEWIVEDSSRRRAGLEEARRAMDLVRQLGGTY